MNTKQIKVLQALVAEGNVWWTDGRTSRHVKEVRLTSAQNGRQVKRPIAVFTAFDEEMALAGVEVSSFVVQQPCLIELHMRPVGFLERFTDALALLCGGRRPSEQLVRDWFNADLDSRHLQDWAVNNMSVAWGTGIGVLDAATAMADNAEEGIDHETREEFLLTTPAAASQTE